METELKNITPAMAKEWLAKNADNNRSLRRDLVQRFAVDMMQGHWRLTHQGIAFAEDGTLVDGQHRLTAIVRANVPVRMYVTKGLAKESIYTIDTGKSRDAKDAMRIQHPDDAIFRSRGVLPTVRMLDEVIRSDRHHRSMSVTEIEEFVQTHYKIFAWEYRLQNIPAYKKFISSTLYTVCICAMANGVPKRAVELFMACVANNQVTDGFAANWKAALDYKTACMDAKAKHMRTNTDEFYALCERSLYCFYANVKKTAKQNIYPITADKLAALNDRIEIMD